MTRIRYTMPARSQGKRQQARLAEKDIHRWVFAHNVAPDVLNNTPPLPSIARNDEAEPAHAK